MRPVRTRLGMLLPAWLLAACGASGVQEVTDWMAAEKQQTPVKVTPLSEPKPYTPFPYAAQHDADPFSPGKLLAELARQAAGADNANGLAPDTRRRKEALESFPLDTMHMVGVIQKPGARFALLQVDKAIYQVRTGNYIGQNYGRVTAIHDTALELTETVQDAAGEWTERKSRLELQENTK